MSRRKVPEILQDCSRKSTGPGQSSPNEECPQATSLIRASPSLEYDEVLHAELLVVHMFTKCTTFLVLLHDPCRPSRASEIEWTMKLQGCARELSLRPVGLTLVVVVCYAAVDFDGFIAQLPGHDNVLCV